MGFLIDMWKEDILGKFVIISTILSILLVWLLILASIEDQKRWDDFSVNHNCKIVSTSEGHSVIGTGMAGSNIAVTTGYIPGQNGWLCDDGITYYRDK